MYKEHSVHRRTLGGLCLTSLGQPRQQEDLSHGIRCCMGPYKHCELGVPKDGNNNDTLPVCLPEGERLRNFSSSFPEVFLFETLNRY